LSCLSTRFNGQFLSNSAYKRCRSMFDGQHSTHKWQVPRFYAGT
jgi:hypothetical protein